MYCLLINKPNHWSGLIFSIAEGINVINKTKALFLSDAVLVKGQYIYQPVTLGCGSCIPLQSGHSALYKLLQRDLGNAGMNVPVGLISEEESRAKKG